MSIQVSPNISAVAGALVWLALLRLEVLTHNLWLGCCVVVAAYALTCVALVRHFRTGKQLGNIASAVCMLSAALFAFTLYGLMLGSLPLAPFPDDYPDLTKFLGLLLPSVVSGATLAVILVVPASLLFGRLNWLVPLLTLVLWRLVDGDSLQFEESRTVGDQLLMFEQASLALIPTALLAVFGPKVRKMVLRAA